ncbi:MAG: DUF6316 family protein [Pseudomonadales bacterium]
MNNTRASDPTDKSFFKSDRFFESNGQWFFSTRETEDQGPFISRDLAASELHAYLKTQVGIQVDSWDTPGVTR